MENNFENLINKDKYQVFLFACPAYFPFNFLRHPWFVLNKKGTLNRFEIAHFKNNKDKDLKHFHKNLYPLFQGVNISFFINYFWKAKLQGYVEGDENSIAEKVIIFIENSKENYPYCNYYRFLGPNSNTYAQNILNKFPEFKVKLSWRFIGKNFKIK